MPRLPGLAKDHADVLGALFHLASKVEGSDDDEVGVGPPDLDLGVNAADVDLGGGHGLLRQFQSADEFVELCDEYEPVYVAAEEACLRLQK